jgi:hypothetical protein
MLSAGALLGAAGVGLAGLRLHDDREARRLWTHLASACAEGRFDADTLSDLPEPAGRYLRHAIAPGTTLTTTVRLEMTGTMRLGPEAPWLPFRARQVFAPHRGFVWRATVGRGVRRFVGGDQYAAGRGAVRFWLWGALPVVRAGGGSSARDVARSAIGRMAAEAVWAPAALLPSREVRWTAPSDEVAVAAFSIDGQPVAVTLTLDPAGAVRRLELRRWGNSTDDGRYAAIPFGAEVAADARFGGYTIPTRLAASWWFGTERQFEFIRVAIHSAAFG